MYRSINGSMIGLQQKYGKSVFTYSFEDGARAPIKENAL